MMIFEIKTRRKYKQTLKLSRLQMFVCYLFLLFIIYLIALLLYNILEHFLIGL